MITAEIRTNARAPHGLTFNSVTLQELETSGSRHLLSRSLETHPYPKQHNTHREHHEHQRQHQNNISACTRACAGTVGARAASRSRSL